MDNLARVRTDVGAAIFKFPIEDGKLKNDGTYKNIPNNKKEDRWVDPIRDRNDIKKVSCYLLEKARNAKRHETEMAGYRNWLLFTIGINVGLRVSDLIELKWSHFFMPDMKTFISNTNKKEKKTDKMKAICPNECMKMAIKNYLKITDIKPRYSDYVFLNVRTMDKITDATVEKMVKEFSKECGLIGNYNTHSLRKTYAYQKYMNYTEHNDPMALVKVQKDLNHRNSSDTARYLGITREEQIDSSMQLGSYLMESIAF